MEEGFGKRGVGHWAKEIQGGKELEEVWGRPREVRREC